MVGALSPHDHGFSLIEVLVVVAVLSVLSVSVTLSIGRGGGSQEPSAVQRFQDMIASKQQSSILERRSHAIAISQSGVQSLSRDVESGAWRLGGTPGRADMVWVMQRGFDSSVLIPYAPEAESPARLLFLPDGRHTPFRLTILNETRNVECSSDGWGSVACR